MISKYAGTFLYFEFANLKLKAKTTTNFCLTDEVKLNMVQNLKFPYLMVKVEAVE